MTPTYIIVCVCVSSNSIDKKIAHCCFYIDKIKNKKLHRTAIFGCTTYYFFWPYNTSVIGVIEIAYVMFCIWV